MKTILVAGAVSLVLALFGTPLAIRIFTRRGYGQAIREEGPAGHATKRGTPTMGGTVIVIASLIGYFTGNVVTGQVPSTSGLLVMMLMISLFGLGITALWLTSGNMQIGTNVNQRTQALYCAEAGIERRLAARQAGAAL